MLKVWKRVNFNLYHFRKCFFSVNESKRLRTVRQSINYTHKDLTNSGDFQEVSYFLYLFWCVKFIQCLLNRNTIKEKLNTEKMF